MTALIALAITVFAAAAAAPAALQWYDHDTRDEDG